MSLKLALMLASTSQQFHEDRLINASKQVLLMSMIEETLRKINNSVLQSSLKAIRKRCVDKA